MTRILYISRAYPPVVGGLENQNYELSVWLSKISELKLIANKFGKPFLPLFLPYSLLRALYLCRNRDAVLLGDSVLSVIGWFLKWFCNKPIVLVAHGLDLTYPLSLYQKLWVRVFVPKVDRIVAVGNETIKIGIEKGIPAEKFVYIPNGVDPEKYLGNYSRADLESVLGESADGKKVILTSGRLARRKGVAWFVSHVMPRLDSNVIYVVAGDGPDKINIAGAVKRCGLEDRVKMLGYVSDEVRNLLLNTCDLFVQPNIKVEGDVEGFGISVIEAGACRLPVIASRLEGLQDAIKEGRNGFLIESGNADRYVAKIRELLSTDNPRKQFGENARQYVIENLSWDRIAQKYLDEIETLVKN